jgi:outer membrane protein TolC
MDLLQVRQGGLTADQVGQRAVDTSFAARQLLETLRSAQAKADQAWVAFLPRLQATARYTRLSNFTPPPLETGVPGFSSVYAVGDFGNGAPLPPNTQLIGVGNASYTFPLILDNYLLQATLTVPISDYFLKTNEAYSSATHSAEAARYDLGAGRAGSYSDAKIAYYTWLQQRGQVIVAVQTLNDQRVRLNDTRNQFSVGNANRADVLRGETAVANAEVQVETAKQAADFAETTLRIALHQPPGTRLYPGEDIATAPPPFQGDLPTLVREGLDQRYEVKSLDENIVATRKQASLARGSQLPTVSAFGDGIYGNPNPRYFPASQTWFPTWDVGLQAVWTPNDVLAQGASARDYEARANALENQKQIEREAIEKEVTQAYEQIRQYDATVEATRRQLASAEEAVRVARELFNNGRGTATTVADAETDLATARLASLNAAVNARIARVRLEHAVGRDLRVAAPAAGQ